MPTNATTRRSRTKRGLGILLTAIGLVLAAAPMQPSPAANVQHHLAVLGRAWASAVPLLAAGVLLLGAFRRLGAAAVAAALLWILFAHPVVERIPDANVPEFETVLSLPERAARGEPFRRMDGHWYLVKPWIGRILFF